MWLEALGAALLLLQALTIVLLWLQVRSLKRMPQARNEHGQALELLTLNALNNIEHRLGLLEERGARAQESAAPRRMADVSAVPVAALKPVEHDPLGMRYELAQQLAREGAELEQVMTRCGLSRNEAELVLRLHAKRA